MKIQFAKKIQAMINGDGRLYKKGEIVEAPDADALALIDGGYAKAVDDDAPAEAEVIDPVVEPAEGFVAEVIEDGSN